MDREQFVRRCRGRYTRTRQHDNRGVIDVVEVLPLVVQVPMADVMEQEWEELSGRIDRVIAATAKAASEAMELEGEREEREGRERSGLCEDAGGRGEREVAEGGGVVGSVGVGGVCAEGRGGVEDAGGGEVLSPVRSGGEPPGVQSEGAAGLGEEAEAGADGG